VGEVHQAGIRAQAQDHSLHDPDEGVLVAEVGKQGDDRATIHGARSRLIRSFRPAAGVIGAAFAGAPFAGGFRSFLDTEIFR